MTGWQLPEPRPARSGPARIPKSVVIAQSLAVGWLLFGAAWITVAATQQHSVPGPVDSVDTNKLDAALGIGLGLVLVAIAGVVTSLAFVLRQTGHYRSLVIGDLIVATIAFLLVVDGTYPSEEIVRAFLWILLAIFLTAAWATLRAFGRSKKVD